MRISEWISLAVMSALAACTSPVETITNVNPKVDISVYKSFSWISDKPLVSHIPDGQPFNPVIETRIKSAIVEGFQSKGYAMVDNSAEADFVIAFTVGTRDKIRLITVPAPYHHYYRRGPGFRAYYYGAPAVSAYTYIEGVLAVDVSDEGFSGGPLAGFPFPRRHQQTLPDARSPMWELYSEWQPDDRKADRPTRARNAVAGSEGHPVSRLRA